MHEHGQASNNIVICRSHGVAMRRRKCSRLPLMLLFFAWVILYFMLYALFIGDIENIINPKDTRDRRISKEARLKGHTIDSQNHSQKVSLRPGDNGTAVVVPDNLLKEADEKFTIHMYNIVAGDLMPLDRTLPDYRSKTCQEKVYPPIDELPSTSVVIIFHKEAWSTLLRTVHSVINRSPRKLMKEIILVDDASKEEELDRKLDEYVAKLPVNTRVVRLKERSGLIVARIKGAEEASGDILIFLDAHCECTEGWLEPLLNEIHKDRTAVPVPMINTIFADNFRYQKGEFLALGGFDPKLMFTWIEPDTNDKVKPLRSPTMAGGLFAIDRKYFFEIGSYDEGMSIWGSENVEISLRIWMCGGKIYANECSKVGHVFRSRSPYTFPGNAHKTIYRNVRRVVEVFLDEFKPLFYKMNPGFKRIEYGDVKGRKRLLKKLKCKNFRWYLENVYPNSPIPLDYITYGEIRNKISGYCIDTFGLKSGERVGLSKCHKEGGNQFFVYSKLNALIANTGCLDVNGKGQPMRIYDCHGLGGNQMWFYDQQTLELKHLTTNQCVSVSNSSSSPILGDCNGSKEQLWLLEGMKR